MARSALPCVEMSGSGPTGQPSHAHRNPLHTHFGYTAALGDNCEVLAPVGPPSASWLASFVPPRSVEADVADSRRSSAGSRPNANAAGHSRPQNADAGKERSDEDLGRQAHSSPIESRRPTELRIRPWHAHHRNRFASRWHVIEELATLVEIVESSVNFYKEVHQLTIPLRQRKRRLRPRCGAPSYKDGLQMIWKSLTK